MIQELDKQSLLPLNSLISLNNRVNILESKNETLYFEICSMLGNMIEKVNRITSIDKLENDVELLQWIASIKYNSYNGIDYKTTQQRCKIVCITDDFFRLTKGEIDVSSLNLLKSTLEQLNLYPDSSISYREFFQHLINDPSLINKLFSTISTEALYTIKTYQAPLLKGIEKVKNCILKTFIFSTKMEKNYSIQSSNSTSSTRGI